MEEYLMNSQTKKGKVLVIDDEKGLRDMLSYALGREGYEVLVAENGEVGVEKVKQEEVNVVVTDIKMPGMDGVAVLKKIKQMNENVEVIVATGYGSMETAIESLRNGAYDYINKPFNIDELISLISKAIERQQMKSQLVSLQELDKMKDEFIAAISHELKSPLMVINGVLELLTSENEDKEKAVEYKYDENTKKLLEMIGKQTKRIKELIENLLDIAKMEAGFFKLDKKKVSLKDIIKTSIEEIKTVADNKKIKVSFLQEKSEDIEIVCDKEQIVRVIKNLLTNAIKYSNEYTEVEVYYEKMDKEVKLTVKDNGIGIEKKNLEKVFDRFFQVSSGTKSGTGLGLSICKKIITMHNGQIWAESEGLGKGSRFIFTLPLSK